MSKDLRVTDDFKTVSTKIPFHKALMLKTYADKKGTTVSKIINDLITNELERPLPHNQAGKNLIEYDPVNDSFDWSVKLDSGQAFTILEGLSPDYLAQLMGVLKKGIDERSNYLKKQKNDSVPVPDAIIRREKNE